MNRVDQRRWRRVGSIASFLLVYFFVQGYPAGAEAPAYAVDYASVLLGVLVALYTWMVSGDD